ncbi:hypothetical protein [Holdemanella biformis]
MIIRKRILSLFLATVLLMPLAQITPLKAESDTKEVDVMFTHDTHSHLDSFTTYRWRTSRSWWFCEN